MTLDLNIIGGPGAILHRDDLPDHGRRAARLYREIRDDTGLVGGVFLALESLFRRVDFTTQPAPAPDGPRGAWTEKRANTWATFVDTCRDDMSHTWHAFTAEILTMLVYGFAPFEICWKYRVGPDELDPTRRSQYTDGRLAWRKFALRHQDSITRWSHDPDGGLLGFHQLTTRGEVFIPIQKAILFRTTEAGSNPEGRSLLRNARRAYVFRKRLEEIEAIGIERDLAGLPHMEVPVDLLNPNATKEQKATLELLQNQLAGIRADERAYLITPATEYVVPDRDGKPIRLPTGYKFSLVTSGGSRAHDTNAVIRRYTTEIATSLLATFLLLGGDGKGAQALSTDLTDFFELAGTGILDGIVATINRHAIAPLMQLNGVPAELWPKLTHGGLSDAALQELLQTVSDLLKSGGLTHDTTLEAHLRERLALPEKPEEEQPTPAPEPPEPSGDGANPAQEEPA